MTSNVGADAEASTRRRTKPRAMRKGLVAAVAVAALAILLGFRAESARAEFTDGPEVRFADGTRAWAQGSCFFGYPVQLTLEATGGVFYWIQIVDRNNRIIAQDNAWTYLQPRPYWRTLSVRQGYMYKVWFTRSVFGVWQMEGHWARKYESAYVAYVDPYLQCFG